MKLLRGPSLDAVRNLAAEEYAFRCLDRREEYVMLWQNGPSVILGKHQNVLEEVNLSYAREHKIPVVRRLSGGGAVYHDLGNLNFTYIVNGEEPGLSMERFAGPLLLACRKFGIDARISGRNDVTAGGRKFSGHAGYQEGGRTMHHGTILLSADLQAMEAVLSAAGGKFRSGNVASVRSRVVNLSECAGRLIGAEEFGPAFLAELFGGEKPAEYVWSGRDRKAIGELARRRYADWEWTYGSFPAYERRQTVYAAGCGTVTVGMSVLGGRIAELTICGDFLGSRPSEELCGRLLGCRLEQETLAQRLKEEQVGRYLYGMSAEFLARLLCGMM